MRIAQVAPLTEAVPPKLYGGTERVVHWLTEELGRTGTRRHAVRQRRFPALPRNSTRHGRRRCGSMAPCAIPNALHMVMLERVRQKCDDEEFDFLHFHLDYYPFSLFYRQPTPFLTTLHGRLDLPEHQPVFTTFSKVPVISISNAQRRPVPQANWVRTIHHGLPENLLTPRAGEARTISPCSAASRRKRASTARSRSRCVAAFRSRSRPRSIAPTRTITTS